MPPSDEALRAFASRPWDEIDRLKRRYWAATHMTPADRLIVAEELRLFAASMRPEWPDAWERKSDLDTHTRVAHLLMKTGHERNS